MIFSSRNYAIGMAHYQMAGGIRSVLALVGAYIGVSALVIGLVCYNIEAPALPRAMRALFTFFLVIESIGLIVVGAGRVGSCIRQDIVGNMIESHRQMPISAARAILGYLLGTTSHLLLLLVVHLLVMAGLASVAGIDQDTFILGQVVLVFFALFAWSFVAMNTFMIKQAMALFVLVGTVGFSASMLLRAWGILPAVSLLITPFLGETIFTLSAGGMNLRAAYPVAFGGQLAFGTLFFIGACRRYRGTFLTTFNVPMGLALVAAWSLLSAVSIRVWPREVIRRMAGFEQPEAPSQVVAALTVAAVLLIVPLHALATWEVRTPVRWRTRLAVLAGVLGVGMLSIFGAPFALLAGAVTLFVLACHVLTMYAALHLFRRLSTPMFIASMVLLLAMLWLVPILAETVRWYFLPENKIQMIRHDLSMLSTLSPMGLLISAWSPEPDQPPWAPGMVLQLLVAVMLFRGWRRRAGIAAEPKSAISAR